MFGRVIVEQRPVGGHVPDDTKIYLLATPENHRSPPA